MKKFLLPIFAALLIYAVNCSSSDSVDDIDPNDTTDTTNPSDPSDPTDPTDPSDPQTEYDYISVVTIDEEFWLVTTKSKPFFAHGINHISSEPSTTSENDIYKAVLSIGFNSYGYGTSDSMTSRDGLPYFVPLSVYVSFSNYTSNDSKLYYDLFDEDVQAEMERLVAADCAKYVNDKNLIGYYWEDMPMWNLDWDSTYNWVVYARELGATAPMKIKYVDFLKERYTSITTFNNQYASGCTSWDDVYSYTFDVVSSSSTKISDDSKEFLTVVAAQYYKILGEATRKNDPNHLIFGDRYSLEKINTDVIDEAIEYIDVISFQPSYSTSFPTSDYDAVYVKYGKPIMICDYAVRFDDGVNVVQSSLGITESAATTGYVSYIQSAFDTKYILGSEWCVLCDLDKGDYIKQGFFTEGLGSRTYLHPAVKSLNASLLAATPSLSE